ncbi:MAG TPA: hypothetical protein VMH06_07700 [Thermodesulfovibrionales bacterium]|nr:hypothetical protein [Thermodesulfovibrionales bacterium]
MDFRRVLFVLLSFGVLVLSGCTSLGPHTVARDRFDYTGALGDSWKEQMLINTVKLRYGDTPVFLDVASVISQYQVAAQANLGFTWVHPVTSAATNAQTVGANAQYVERPTITYTPLSGEKFARSLMRPLPPPGVLSLIQAGYPIDLVLRLCVNTVNGIRNRYGGAGRAHSADPEFYPLLERLKRIQDSGAIGLRVQKTDEMEGVVMSFRGKVDPSVQEDILFVRKTLGLDPSTGEIRVAYGSVAKDDKELAMLTRSILEIIIDLGSYIEVPSAHAEEKRVNPTMPEEVVQGVPVPPLVRIHSSTDKPADAFIAVPYRNHWFWIDDHDLRSKMLFSFMMFIFSLTETGGAKEGAPIITVPTG